MSNTLNLSLENPYSNVSIPRAKLRSAEDSGTVIINPLAIGGTEQGRASSLNPYSSFKTQGEQGQGASRVPVGQNSAPYQVQSAYAVKESEEEVSRCYACCCRCRRKKK
uniref:Si:ch211-202f5.3 n=1 Tax=Scleropages formosus TaxID=113540 RepID=A0A8C9RCH4_SCLFO